MPKNQRRFLWLALIALVIAASVYVIQRKSKTADQALTFDTVTLEQGPIVAKVTASGTLSALVTVQIGSQISGRIQKLFVDFNSEVKKGQILATIDPQFFEAAYEQAKANLIAAKSYLTKAQVQALEAQRQYARTQNLDQRQLISKAEVDTAEATTNAAKAEVESAKSSVEQAQATLKQAQVNLNYTTIRSPIDGIVISRSVDVGQTVAASLQAPTLFMIAEDLRKMQVDTSVAEADVGKLAAGMNVNFMVDAYPNERFSGTVRQIRHAAQTVQNVVTYDAVINVDNPDMKLRPGMTANVVFTYAEKLNVLKVPNAALRFRPSEDMLTEPLPKGKVVWILKQNKPVPIAVETGISDGSFTEITAGELTSADVVIIDMKNPDAKRTVPTGGLRRVF